MKYLSLLTLPLLFACASSRHLALEDAARKDVPGAACAGSCTADVNCTPDGHCVITCYGPNDQRCEIELDCSGNTCTVVRCEGFECGGSKACSETKPD